MKFLLGTFLLLFSFTSFSYEVTFGDPEKTDKRNAVDLLGTIGEKVYIYKYKPMPLGVEKHTLLQFDPNTLQSTKEAKIEIKRKNLERMVIFNNQILIFQSEKNKKAGTQRVWYDIYDASSLRLKKGNIELLNLEYKKGLFKKLNSFTMIMSEDESVMAIYYNLPYEKGAAEKFGFIVYDEDMEKIYAQETELPQPDELMNLGGPHISNEGKFYMSAVETTEKGFFGTPKAVRNHIYHVSEDGELIDHEINLPNARYIFDYTYSTNANGELICTGLYGSEERPGVNGGFYIRLDEKTNEIAESDYSKFPEKFITEGWSDRAKKKAEKKKAKGKGGPKLYNYDIRAIVTLKDGNAVFVAEQYYVVVHTYTDANGNTRTTYHYYYNDIIVMKLNSDGKFDWYAKIPKYQHSVNDGGYYSSFAFHAGDEKLYFMFNDNIKNYEDGNATGGKTYATSFKSNKKNVTSLAEVNLADGEVIKKQLFGKADLGMIAIPKMHYSDIENDALFIYAKKKKKERLGKIRF